MRCLQSRPPQVQEEWLLYNSPDDFAARNDPKKQEAFWGSFLPYVKAIRDAGIFVGGSGLEGPEMATTLRLEKGQRKVQDGLYADTKEQLGGLFMIRVPNLDVALEWAARCPVGVVEVRPNMPAPGAPGA